MKKIILITLLSIGIPAQANEYVSVNMFSSHAIHCNAKLRDCPDFNRRNFGVGIHTDEWISGFYRNSFRETSIYAGRRFSNEAKVISLNVGLVSGYHGYPEVKSWEVGNLNVFAYPQWHIGWYHRLTVTWMYNAFAFNFEFRVK